ncbi:MAG: FAD-binding oxidoreductase, partial [Burkholderiaceae bacterium]|nr:FAD-binding oxidoreductase [Burkholderiaceae bacterium]
MTTTHAAAISSWTKLLGAAQVLSTAAAQQAYGLDTTASSRKLVAALKPSASEQIPEIIRIAKANRTSIYPISTGNNWGYGTSLPAANDCVLLDLSGLSQIKEFDAELGVITVEPGVTQGMLAKFLDEGGHDFMVPVTGGGPNCSLLGNALERGYGVTPHTDHFGAVTHIEAVLADGSIYRSGLHEAGGIEVAKLFKWGIGPYINGLFTQSGFGVVTQMTILLARRPQCSKVCFFSIPDDQMLEEAVRRVQRILQTLPGIVGGSNLMNRHRMLAMAAPYPATQIGPNGLIPEEVIAAMGREYQIFPWTGFMTLYGSKKVVAAAQKEIRNILKGFAKRLVFLSNGQAQGLAKLAKLIPGRLGQRAGSTAQTLAKSLELVGGRPNETAMPLAYWRNPNPPKGPSRDPGRDGSGLIWYAPLVPMRPQAARSFVD